jgi:hypothetical protein
MTGEDFVGIALVISGWAGCKGKCHFRAVYK